MGDAGALSHLLRFIQLVLPGSDSYFPLTLAIADGEGMNTFPADSPSIKIDYILFRPAHRWKVLEARVLDEPVASDHRPLLVVLELLPEKTN
jgi:endonuclease/exonuclease/phosphatase family metal-dependent hydrolase